MHQLLVVVPNHLGFSDLTAAVLGYFVLIQNEIIADPIQSDRPFILQVVYIQSLVVLDAGGHVVLDLKGIKHEGVVKPYLQNFSHVLVLHRLELMLYNRQLILKIVEKFLSLGHQSIGLDMLDHQLVKQGHLEVS